VEIFQYFSDFLPFVLQKRVINFVISISISSYHILRTEIIRIVFFFRCFESFPVIQVMASKRHVKSCFSFCWMNWDKTQKRRISFPERRMGPVVTQCGVQCWHTKGYVKNRRKKRNIKLADTAFSICDLGLVLLHCIVIGNIYSSCYKVVYLVL